MVPGHPFGLVPLWEGEISVCIVAIPNGAQDLYGKENQRDSLLCCSTWCGSGWGPCPVVTAKMLVPGEAALLTEWTWVTLIPAQPR